MRKKLFSLYKLKFRRLNRFSTAKLFAVNFVLALAVLLLTSTITNAQGDIVTKVWVADNGGEGKWIGAKFGLFFTGNGKFNNAGTADVDWFRFE